ncbi:MAG: DNA repair protein RecN [Treponemataceae bacterium]|nr:DNA repair protein RecN [Treponemataceae bacterium]
MLEDLTIKDFALIDSLQIEFTKGFNVLTGETGAGKSILIGALSFLLGGRADISQIRTGSTEARVSGTVFISQKQKGALAWLNEHGIELENDRVLLRRTIKDSGKTSAWVGDTPVTKNELADFTAYLVDIHGQHEHQSLMKVSEHRKFLDSYALLNDEVSAFTKLYTQLVEKRRLLNEMNTSDAERSEKIELLRFAVEEIDSAQLKPEEEAELSAEEGRLSQYEKLFADVEVVNEALSGDESIVAGIKRLRPVLERTASIDSSLKSFTSRLETAYYELEDIADELRAYKNQLVFDPARLEEVQERLALIFRLKKKYCTAGVNGNIEEILQYSAKAQEQLETLCNFEGNRAELEAEVSALEKKVYLAAKSISDKRHQAASQMGPKIEAVLAELGMRGTVFNAGLEQKPFDGDFQKIGPYGFDNVEFLISANPGSPLRPLAKIASGGELSRVMLALKTILADIDTTPTLIFDEIDTGIGGEVAVSIGAHIKKLAEKHQILCISHLANIAVCADTHIKIAKFVENQKTTTKVHVITGQERVTEISRMLAGDMVSEASLEHARALLSRYGGQI